METNELYSHKNEILLMFETEKVYKTVSVSEWNGRDSDDLCDTINTKKKVFNYTICKAYIATPNSVKMQEKKNAINEINEILNKNFMPSYSEHVKISLTYEPYCQFEIEEEIEISSMKKTVFIHFGIKGAYPIKDTFLSPHFNIEGEMWSHGKFETVDENVFELAILALEEKNIKIDERYI
jgi:hypothetical protein